MKWLLILGFTLNSVASFAGTLRVDTATGVRDAQIVRIHSSGETLVIETNDPQVACALQNSENNSLTALTWTTVLDRNDVTIKCSAYNQHTMQKIVGTILGKEFKK